MEYGGIAAYLVVVVAGILAVLVLVVALIRLVLVATTVLRLSAEERRLRIDLLMAGPSDDE